MLNYKITPCLTTSNEDLKGLFGELNYCTFLDIDGYNIIFQRVLQNVSGFEVIHLQVIKLEITKETIKVFWIDELVTEVPTKELYIILTKFRDSLLSFENDDKNSNILT